MTDTFLKKFAAYLKSARFELIAIVVIAALDLISKNIVEATMELGQRIAVIPGFLYFYYIHNTKAAYGSAFGLEKIFGEDGVINFFIVLTVIALVAFGYLMWCFRNRHILSRLSIAFIIGGAFGNLVDRIALRAVRDFINIKIGDFAPFGSFNIADMALVFGVIMFAVYFLFFFDRDEKKLKRALAGSAEEQDPESAAPCIEAEMNKASYDNADNLQSERSDSSDGAEEAGVPSELKANAPDDALAPDSDTDTDESHS